MHVQKQVHTSLVVNFHTNVTLNFEWVSEWVRACVSEYLSAWVSIWVPVNELTFQVNCEWWSHLHTKRQNQCTSPEEVGIFCDVLLSSCFQWTCWMVFKCKCDSKTPGNRELWAGRLRGAKLWAAEQLICIRSISCAQTYSEYSWY